MLIYKALYDREHLSVLTIGIFFLFFFNVNVLTSTLTRFHEATTFWNGYSLPTSDLRLALSCGQPIGSPQ